jgi:hypothetical protein
MAPQFDRALRDLLRAAGCTFVRQSNMAVIALPESTTLYGKMPTVS